jgi:Tfp pilus assembly protein PilF
MAEQAETTYVYYLERIASKVGTGDTAKDATMENYWHAKPLGGGMFRIELLDMHDQPSGYGEEVNEQELKTRFTFLPGYTPRQATPRQQQADRIVARAERHFEKEEYLSAEFEFSKALKLDEDNVRANFGLGRTYMAMGDGDKAKQVFRKLSTIEAVLEPRNKYIFNEFGIQLRKMGMFEEAVRHYHRALLVEKFDENLWFNLGRALFEGGQAQAACKALAKAISINSEFEDARSYLALVERLSQEKK